MKKRIIAGVTIVILVIWVFVMPVKYFYILYAILAMTCCVEYMNMLQKSGRRPVRAIAYAWPAAFTIILYNLQYQSFWKAAKPDLTLFITFSLMIFISVAVFSKKYKMDDVVNTVFGCLYSVALLGFAVLLIEMPMGKWLLGFVVLGGVATDVFSYFTGYFLGRRKIIPGISPKKTIEGSIGGYVACTVVLFSYSVIMKSIAGDIPEIWKLVVVIALSGAVAQVGDWSASYIKRQFGIKDFGKWIPGHGGLTDRLDSIMFLAPFMFLIFLI